MTGGTVAARPRWRVQDCVERGLRTRRAELLPYLGAWLENAGGLRARFSLEVAAGHVARVHFECTPCVTLVAYCQALAEYETGRALAATPALDAEALAGRLEGVPPARQDRAALAVAAWRTAILQAAAEPAP